MCSHCCLPVTQSHRPRLIILPYSEVTLSPALDLDQSVTCPAFLSRPRPTNVSLLAAVIVVILLPGAGDQTVHAYAFSRELNGNEKV